MVDVCLAVRSGAGDPEAVIDAVRACLPGARCTAVWGDDPQRRPVAPAGAPWVDLDLEERHGLGWERLTVAAGASRAGVAKAVTAVVAGRVASDCLIISVGDLVVTGDLGRLVTTSGATVARRDRPPAIADGLGPTSAEAAGWGTVGAALLACGGGDLRALADALVLAPPAWSAAQVATEIVASGQLADDLGGVAFVGDAPVAGEPIAVDVTALDPVESWHIRSERGARHPLSADPSLVALLETHRRQWAGPGPLTSLPGGVRIDPAIEALLREAIEAWRLTGRSLPPEPFSDAAAFRRWLEAPAAEWRADVGRYWTAWHAIRPDLPGAFPRPEGDDYPRFRDWTRHRWFIDDESVLIRSGAGAMRAPWVDVGREPGINLVGYHGYDKSLGDVVRRMRRSLEAAGVPHDALDYRRSGSPRTAEPPPTTDELRYDTNLCVINADQFSNLMIDHGDALRPGRRTIGYWFWEVDKIPPDHARALGLVDEIWVGTDYVGDVFRALTDVPVRTVPIPVPEPDVPDISRSELGLPADRFVFVVTFDYLSIAERKNPVGAVEAFRRAFPIEQPDGPVLVVKSLNAHHRPHAAERTALAAAGRGDILLIDRHATRDEQHALVAQADCLVSLHRAEGLGLHLMEAMWMSTPTIATRFSGNLMFCTDANCALIDAELGTVRDGDGYLPIGSTWAEPDLDQAAAAMQRMVDDVPWRTSLVAQGRATMEAQASLADTGRLIADLCATGRGGTT